jgi:hypothetical protein
MIVAVLLPNYLLIPYFIANETANQKNEYCHLLMNKKWKTFNENAME